MEKKIANLKKMSVLIDDINSWINESPTKSFSELKSELINNVRSTFRIQDTDERAKKNIETLSEIIQNFEDGFVKQSKITDAQIMEINRVSSLIGLKIDNADGVTLSDQLDKLSKTYKTMVKDVLNELIKSTKKSTVEVHLATIESKLDKEPMLTALFVQAYPSLKAKIKSAVDYHHGIKKPKADKKPEAKPAE